MKYGFVMPSGDARTAADLAQRAEQAGWDGFFVWEPVWGVDAWVCLTAAAMVTSRIRLGTMITPLSRMRPWKLASETATLDNLSGGRVILSVGLGAPDTGFRRLRRGDRPGDPRRTARRGSGNPDRIVERPAFPVMRASITTSSRLISCPLRRRSSSRAFRSGWWESGREINRCAASCAYDGLLPSTLGTDDKAGQASPREVREMRAYVQERRTLKTPFDIIVEGETPGDDAARAQEIIRPWVEAGATWWIEAMWNASSESNVLARLEQGPPV